MKKGYGWQPQKPDFRDYKFKPKIARLDVPPTVDLRPLMPPVYDQGELGSCTANAIAAAVDYERGRQGMPFMSPSRLFIYANERIREGTPLDQDSGAEIRDGIKSLVGDGVCPESEWPYIESQFSVRPPDSAYIAAQKELLLQYQAVDQSAIKQALAGGFPVIFGFTVYDSFESDNVAATGIVPMPADTESVQGGHAVVAVGYTQDGNYLVRNSWGTEWGLNGYFKMPSSYLENPNLASDFWSLVKVE